MRGFEFGVILGSFIDTLHKNCHVYISAVYLQTDPGTHPTSYAMDTGSLPGLKRPARGVGHAPTSSAGVKERVDLYLYSPSGLSWPVLG